MLTASRTALGLLLSIGVARAAPPEHIGRWVLTCPGETPHADPCLLRFDKPFLDQGGITGDLEIQASGKSLVPVLTLRGLPADLLMAASLAGKAEASLQFGGGSPEPLSCAPASDAYICWPKDDATAKLAAELPSARTITVRVSVSVTGLQPRPARQKSLGLTGTKAALRRLREAGPSHVPASTLPKPALQSPGRLMTMAGRALKAAGYQNGLADLQALLAKYHRK